MTHLSLSRCLSLSTFTHFKLLLVPFAFRLIFLVPQHCLVQLNNSHWVKLSSNILFSIQTVFFNSLCLIIVYYVIMWLTIQVFVYSYMCVCVCVCVFVCVCVIGGSRLSVFCVLLRYESVRFASTQCVICHHNLKMDTDMLREYV